MLQREDYSVRNLETDGGDEVWKVELGRFSALDFDVDSKSRRGSSRSGGGQGMNGRDDDDTWDEPDEDSIHVVGGRRRGAAATAASVDSKEKKSGAGVPPILGDKKNSGFRHDHQHTGGGRKEGLFEHDEDDFDHDHSHFRGFPSIAFGEVSSYLTFCLQLYCIEHHLITPFSLVLSPTSRMEHPSWQWMDTVARCSGNAE